MKPSNLKFKFLLFSVLLSFSFYASAQSNLEPSCGTTTSEEFIDYYKSIKQKTSVFEQDFTQMKFSKTTNSKKTINYIPIKAHIVRSENGSKGLSATSINNAIKNLNEIYSEAFMKFILIDDINYIDSDLSSNFKKGNEKNLVKENYATNAINIYFIDYIENASGSSLCGYTEEKNNVIVMKNACAVNTSSLAHEMGHFFSLIHTHGPSNTKTTTEYVNGSNCDTDGDGICDTPADPKLSSDAIDTSCNYQGNITDAHGDVFSPDTENIMSYSRKSCRSHFTEQQFSRMYGYYKSIEDRFTSDFSDINTKTDDLLLNTKIYPNPVSNGKIFIKTSSQTESDISFQITNIQGQMLSKGMTTNGQIDVNNLPSGSYLLILENNFSRVIKKFIK